MYQFESTCHDADGRELDCLVEYDYPHKLDRPILLSDRYDIEITKITVLAQRAYNSTDFYTSKLRIHKDIEVEPDFDEPWYKELVHNAWIDLNDQREAV